MKANDFLLRFSLFTGISLLLLTKTLHFPGLLGFVGYDLKRLVQTLLILLLVTLVIISSTIAKYVLVVWSNFTPVVKNLIIASFALAIISVALSQEPRLALLELSTFIGLGLIAFMVAYLVGSGTSLLPFIFLVMLVADVTLYEVSFLSGFAASLIEQLPAQWNLLFPGFSNVRFFNQYQIWTLSLLPLVITFNFPLRRKQRIAIGVVTIIWFSLLFLSSSKGAIIAIVGSILIAAAVFYRSAKRLILVYSGLLISGYLLYFLVSISASQMISRWQGAVSQWGSTSERLTLWKIALSHTIENPAFGIGPMHYALNPNGIAAHPHNSLLQLSAEFGIPFTLFVFILSTLGLRSWILFCKETVPPTPNNWEGQLPIALFVAIMSGFIYSLISGVIVMPMSQTIFAFIAGWMIGIYYRPAIMQSPVKSIDSNRIAITRGFFLVVFISLIYGLIPHMETAIDTTETVIPIQPRYWQHGIVH